MDKEPRDPKDKPSEGEEDWPPPFDPDPRLVRFLEGGSKRKAEEWFRRELEKIKNRE